MCMWVKHKALSNKDITIMKVASHMKYIDLKQILYRSYIKMGNIEKDVVNIVGGT